MAAVVENTITLDPEKEYEIVNGIPEEKEMAGAWHGRIAAKLTSRLSMYAEANEMGVIYGPNTTFKIGRNEHRPDVSFVSVNQIPEGGDPEGIWQIAPDLAVKITLPNDTYMKVMNAVFDYLDEGVKQVWLICPERKTLAIYYSMTKSKTLTENDLLICEELLPGFSCKVGDLFTLPKRRQ